jgi:ubiquinol-cytochrome c reductase iron-sulfur subunit
LATGVRKPLRIALKYFGLVAGLVIAYVLLDFAIDTRPPAVQDSYRFEVGTLVEDEPRILRRDNLSILILRRSAATIDGLRASTAGLQDPESRRSSQPSWAVNSLRSRRPELFVSYATGTDFGCGLKVLDSAFAEICGSARYDFAGRALAGERRFRNLAIPDYNFSGDYRYLTIRP